MTKAQKIHGTDEAWDDGTLGESMEHAAIAPVELQKAVEESLAMQPISIRLPKKVIDLYKALAELDGIGYQPLMREALVRFAASEAKMKIMEIADSKKEARKGAPPPTKKAA